VGRGIPAFAEAHSPYATRDNIVVSEAQLQFKQARQQRDQLATYDATEALGSVPL
jgi:hypothetical protein